MLCRAEIDQSVLPMKYSNMLSSESGAGSRSSKCAPCAGSTCAMQAGREVVDVLDEEAPRRDRGDLARGVAVGDVQQARAEADVGERRVRAIDGVLLQDVLLVLGGLRPAGAW